ncbi:MAG TPA: protein translocase subunit SecD [Candidatus Babeliales bacterium]|nr:protein translocase subunit SecD [Candidatus Babeliales bacterium]
MNASMRNILSTSFIAWIAAAILGIIYLFTFSDGRFKLREDRVKFGIDLVGGTYITLEVQTEKAIEVELADKAQSLIKKMDEAHMAIPVAQSQEQAQIVWKFDSLQSAQEAAQFVTKNEPTFAVNAAENVVTLSIKEAAAKRIRDWAVQGNIEVLRTRIDRLGVGEIPIASQGDKNIVIELPNVDNPQQAKAMIGKAALLEIKLVERSGASREDILDAYDGDLPEGMEILPGKDERDGRRWYYLVPKYTDLTGRLLKDAYTGFGGQTQSEVVVHFKFNPDGGEKFYDLTRKNHNRQIALILDGEVISAPRISVPISTDGYIHGNFTAESANELAMLLKSGAFVAPVKFVEERQIGPSLGQESIKQGLMACLIGMALLLLFSVIFYKTAGVFAFLALIFNLLVILVALAWLRATLTLPGIAGMVLTVGMAIDASILIYEKIKEELANGTALRKAVDVGFSDAMAVILDSNITTFLVGIVLYKFGTGPIQGFAVTMMVGIIATLITGLFFLRSIFNFVLYALGIQKLSI